MQELLAHKLYSSHDYHCYEVVPGLFIGSLRSLGLVAALEVTHVLSAVNFEVTSELGGRPHLRIPLRDDEAESLLPHLPSAIAFIHEALAGDAGGKVLVHCQAGRSRSVALVVAYLMKSQGLGAQEALDLVRITNPDAEPNEGYWAQLLLFQDMRCRLDEDHPVYRLWRLEQVGRRWEEDGCWADGDTFASPPTDEEARSLQVAVYRCRKCRRLLCSQQHVLPVEAAMGHRMFKSFWKTRTAPCGEHDQELKAEVESLRPAGTGQGKAAGSGPASSSAGGGGGGGSGGGPGASALFLEPMSWMAGAVVGETQGKLYCPGCSARLGSFNWAGISNERGAWVTPGFQLHLSKLDVVEPPRVREATVQIRRPVFGTAPAQQAQAPRRKSGSGATQGTGPGQAAGEGLTAAGEASTPETAAGVAVGRAAEPAAAIAAMAAAAATREATAAAREEDVSEATAEAGGRTGLVAERVGEGGQQSAPVAVPVFTHVVLDCDGVLVDTERASCEALRRAILRVTGFDIPHDFPQDFFPVFGMDVRSCFEYYKATFAQSAWDVEQLAAEAVHVKEGIYKELTAEGISAFPHAQELILQARAMGLGVGIASSGAPEKIRHNLSSSGLAGLVDEQFIVSAAYVNKGKPAPDVYLEALHRLQCSEPGRALVVEDAVNGLKAARGAGAFTVAVTTSLPAERLRPHADVVVTDLSEVLEMLRRQASS